MSRSDRAIVARWKGKLKVREGLLAFARRQAAFWRVAKSKLKPGTAAYSHAGAMLADRERKVGHRKLQVEDARLVIERHSVSGPSTMYDSITLSAIPRDAKAVAGYVGGRWPTYSKLASMFPHAERISIAVSASQDAEVLDVEPGDATPAQAPAWYLRQKRRGVKRPVIYCAVSQARTVVATMERHGIRRSSYRLWTAHYTHRAHVCDKGCGFGMPTTADATQFTDHALGRNLDESRVAQSFWS